MSDQKPKKTPSMLKRDEHNQIIDPTEAKRISDELLAKLMTEQRLHEKDQSMHLSRSGRRDIVVHISVTVLGQADGHPIIGEKDREYNQWCFVLPAKRLPCTLGTINRAMAELVQAAKGALMSIGSVRG